MDTGYCTNSKCVEAFSEVGKLTHMIIFLFWGYTFTFDYLIVVINFQLFLEQLECVIQGKETSIRCYFFLHHELALTIISWKHMICSTKHLVITICCLFGSDFLFLSFLSFPVGYV